MRSAIAFVGAALLLAGGAWWAVSSRAGGKDGASPSPGDETAGSTTAPPSKSPARLDASPPRVHPAAPSAEGAGDDKPARSPEATGTLVLRGRLLGKDGKPLSGAHVRAVRVRHGRDASEGVTATTAADGTFSIEGVPAGDYELLTDDGTGERLAKANVTAGADPIELTRLDPPEKGPLAIRGRLLDAEGKPIAGARIRARDTRPWPGTGPRPGVMTAEDGTFAIEDLPLGNFQLFANDDSGERMAAPFVSSGRPAFDVKPMKPDPTPGPGIRKTLVVGPDGHPVPKAQVVITTARGWTSYGTIKNGALWRDPKEADTTYMVFGAQTEDGQSLGLGPMTYRPSGTGDDDSMRLLVGKTIEGRVVDADGTGLFGVEMSARAGSGPAKAIGPSPMRVDDRTTTSADGTFRLTGLGEGAYHVDAVPLPPYLTSPGVDADAGARGVEIRVGRGAEAEVRVLDPDGKPVAGAFVSVRTAKPVNSTRPTPRGMETQLSDANGVVRLSQLDPAETYVLSATAPGGAQAGRVDQNPWTIGPTTLRLPAAK